MPTATPLRPIVLAASLFIVAGCASQSDPKPAICDGHHRRPANPYGSVLPTAPISDAAKPPGAAPAPPARTPSASPGPVSSLDPLSLSPCGAGA